LGRTQKKQTVGEGHEGGGKGKPKIRDTGTRQEKTRGKEGKLFSMSNLTLTFLDLKRRGNLMGGEENHQWENTR